MLLAIDSTNKGYCAALTNFKELLFSFEETDAKSQYLVADLKKAFKEASVDLKELKYIVVNTGPGSFTAIRTALTLVNTLCANLELDLIPVNQFQLLRFVMRLGPKEPLSFSASEKNSNEFFVSLDNDYDNLETNFFANENHSAQILSMPLDKSNAEYLIDYAFEAKEQIKKLVKKTIKPYYLREPSLRKAKTNV